MTNPGKDVRAGQQGDNMKNWDECGSSVPDVNEIPQQRPAPAAHVASLPAQEPAAPAAPPDYESAYKETSKVRERAEKLLGGEYLGWNWVHALVDKLEKEDACTCAEDYLNPACPVHGAPQQDGLEQELFKIAKNECGVADGRAMLLAEKISSLVRTRLVQSAEEARQKAVEEVRDTVHKMVWGMQQPRESYIAGFRDCKDWVLDVLRALSSESEPS